MHTDTASHAGSDAIVASAQARGVPGRLGAADADVARRPQRLVVRGAGLDRQHARRSRSRSAPARTACRRWCRPTSAAGALSGAHARRQRRSPTTTQTIKGVEYAVFAAAGGAYGPRTPGDRRRRRSRRRRPPATADATLTRPWRTDEPATTREAATGRAHGAAEAERAAMPTRAAHSVALSGLHPGRRLSLPASTSTTYTASARRRDPRARRDGATLTTRARALSDTTAAEFGAGHDRRERVRRRRPATARSPPDPTVGAEFGGTGASGRLDGARLAARRRGGLSRRVAGSTARARNRARRSAPAARWSSRHVRRPAFQHVGFGVDYNSPPGRCSAHARRTEHGAVRADGLRSRDAPRRRLARASPHRSPHRVGRDLRRLLRRRPVEATPYGAPRAPDAAARERPGQSAAAGSRSTGPA